MVHRAFAAPLRRSECPSASPAAVVPDSRPGLSRPPAPSNLSPDRCLARHGRLLPASGCAGTEDIHDEVSLPLAAPPNAARRLRLRPGPAARPRRCVAGQCRRCSRARRGRRWPAAHRSRPIRPWARLPSPRVAARRIRRRYRRRSGGEILEAQRISRVQDLQQVLPSVNVAYIHARQSSVAVRGIGNNPASDGLEGSAGSTSSLGRPGRPCDLLTASNARGSRASPCAASATTRQRRRKAAPGSTSTTSTWGVREWPCSTCWTSSNWSCCAVRRALCSARTPPPGC